MPPSEPAIPDAPTPDDLPRAPAQDISSPAGPEPEGPEPEGSAESLGPENPGIDEPLPEPSPAAIAVRLPRDEERPPRRLYLSGSLLTIGALVALSALGLRLHNTPPPAAQPTPAADTQIFQLPGLNSPVKPQNPPASGKTPPLQPIPGLPAPAPGKVAPTDPAATAFEAAAALQKAGKTAEAAAAYEELLKQKPDLIPAHLNVAILYAGNKQPAKALPHLQAARKLDGKNAAVAFQLAQTLLQLQRPAEAEEPLKATVRIAPKNPQGWSMLGQVRLALKNPQGALAAFTEASDLAPKDPGAAFMAGAVALDNLNKGAAAEKYIRRAIAVEPRDPRGPLYLGRALAAQRKLSEAEDTLEKAVKRFPKIPELNTTLAQVRAERGDRSGSIEALRAALKETPESLGKGVPAGGLNAEIGKQLVSAGRWKEAVAALSGAVRLLPTQPEPSAMLVEAAIRSKNSAAAISELRRTLKLDPKRSPSRRILARILAESGKVAEARTEYRAFIAAEPKDLSAVAELADLEEKSKNAKAALALWQGAAKKAPDNPLPHLQVARLLENTDRNAALEKYSYVLQIAPNDLNALWGAAKIEEKTKRTGAALSHLRALVGAQPDFVPAYHPLLRVSAAREQMPATLNFLTQKLVRSPEHPAPYYIVLEYYREKDIETGRKWVKNIIEKQPKAKAARRALDEFDLDIAKKKLEALRNAKPTPTAEPVKPTATPEKTPEEPAKPEPNAAGSAEPTAETSP